MISSWPFTETGVFGVGFWVLAVGGWLLVAGGWIAAGWTGAACGEATDSSVAADCGAAAGCGEVAELLLTADCCLLSADR